jgi:glycosyltransferase involved in cell wall biosynthesis
MSRKRLSICYAAPGQNLVSTAGGTRNVLSAAEAMSQWADVTVAFRSIPEAAPARSYRLIAIDETPRVAGVIADDVVVRGLNPFSHASYLRMLPHFARRAAGTYDVVFEKGWRFSGYLARQMQKRGIPSALIENDARFWNEPLVSLKACARYLAQGATQFVAARCSRALPLIIAETDELKEVLVTLRGIEAERIEVVALGVDHQLFRPQDQTEARAQLGIDPAITIVLYVGGLDIYHDLGPLIEALGMAHLPGIELHVVGDGALRQEYENSARRLNVTTRFHGSVPHKKVPTYIAASDLCVAPYQPSRFYAGKIAFSTLKIPEYMACARPVASVPHGSITRLIEHDVTGFLLENSPEPWSQLLRQLPPRSRLAAMGRAAAAHVAPLSWDATAARYVELAHQLVERRP